MAQTLLEEPSKRIVSLTAKLCLATNNISLELLHSLSVAHITTRQKTCHIYQKNLRAYQVELGTNSHLGVCHGVGESRSFQRLMLSMAGKQKILAKYHGLLQSTNGTF